MSFPPPPSSRPDPSPEEALALDWFRRQNRGLGPAEAAELERWLGEDPRNRAAFEEICGTWELMGRLSGVAANDSGPPRGLGARRSAAFGWLAGSLAAAAAIAAVVALRTPSPTHYTEAVQTEIGGLQRVALPDGSAIVVNTDTALQTTYTAAERRVLLSRGEAHFTVAKNPARPFYVQAGNVVVRAVGTAFDVRFDRDSVAVMVTEGKVRVDDTDSGRSYLGSGGPGSEPLLTAGYCAVIPLSMRPGPARSAAVTSLPQAEIGRALAWERHQIDFDSAPLSQMVAEFNRYNRHHLVIGDPALAPRRFGGSFRSDDYAGFARMLSQNFGISAAKHGNETVLTLAR